MVNKNIIKNIILYILIISNVYFFAFPVNAASLQNAFGQGSNLEKVAGLEGAGYKTTDTTNTPEKIISTIINVVLGFLGVIFLFLIIYAGFMWMTARGNEQQLDKAKDTLTAAIIGLIIIASAYAISYFVVSKISDQTLESSAYDTPVN
jgi:hypothetical protein